MAPTTSSRLTLANWPLAQLPGLCDRTPAAQSNHPLSVFHAHGITTTQQLLAQARTPAQQQQLAINLQIHPQQMRKWVALAHLAQIPAVGPQYCGLILHAGVSSCAQLAHMPAARLHQQILRLQVALLQRRDQCPNVAAVSQWIQQARQLTRP